MYEELDRFIGNDKGITYKQICNETGLNYTTGKAKIIQIEDINRYFEINKVKTKYFIIKRREIPIIKIDHRSEGNSNKYASDIETILLYNLQNEKGNIFECTINKALAMCRMVNQNYSIARKEIAYTSKILDVDSKSIYRFYDDTHIRLKDNFIRALNRMEKQSLIFYEKRVKIVHKEVILQENENGNIKISRGNKISYKINEIHTYATDEELEFILKCKQEVMEKIGCTSEQNIYISGLWSTYREMLSDKLLEEANISYYYDVYKIIMNKDKINKVIDNLEKNNALKNINKNIIEALTETTNKKLQKEYDNTYCNDRKIMIDNTIDCNCKLDLTNEIKERKLMNEKLRTKKLAKIIDAIKDIETEYED